MGLNIDVKLDPLDEMNSCHRAGLSDGVVSTQTIQIWVNFGRSCNERCFRDIWSTLCTFGIFCDKLVNFGVNWYVLWTFVIFSGKLVYFM
jgi:hypothetical protein